MRWRTGSSISSRWSAEYALLRGLGRMHVFPGDDVGARANLARQLAVTGVDDYEAVRRTVASWHPHEGLVYFHLLLDRLASRGVIASDAPPQRTSSPQQ
jgi:DNA-3-methyladenine glycosylase II